MQLVENIWAIFAQNAQEPDAFACFGKTALHKNKPRSDRGWVVGYTMRHSVFSSTSSSGRLGTQ